MNKRNKGPKIAGLKILVHLIQNKSHGSTRLFEL